RTASGGSSGSAETPAASCSNRRPVSRAGSMAHRTTLLIAIAPFLAAVAAVTTALALSSADEPPNSKAAKQRVAIVTQCAQNDPGSAVFELTPLQAGVL